MKRRWIRGFALLMLAAAVIFAAGMPGTDARAEAETGRVYTDENGSKFRIVPLGDGRYELWQLVDVQKGSEETVTVGEGQECAHAHLAWDTGNEQFHWQMCVDCGKLFPPEKHAFDQVKVVKAATCTQNAVLQRSCACGRKDSGNTAPKAGDPAEYFAHHTWGGEYESDLFGHWQHCTVCGEPDSTHLHTISGLKAEKEPTCLVNGWVSFDCSVCGGHFTTDASSYAVEMYPALKAYQALGHDYSGPLKPVNGGKKVTGRSEGNHAASCIRCGSADYSNKTPHSWAEYTISNGTCEDETDPVIIGGTCECGATLELKYTRHHSFVKDESKDILPTCTEPGKQHGERCRYCGIFGNYDLTEPLGHDWWEDESLRKEPTCLEDGEKHEYCFRCDETRVTPIKSKNTNKQHVFVVHVIKEAKCGETGWWEKRCKYCDTTWDEGVVFEKLDHDNVSTTVEKELDLRRLDNGTIVRPVINTTTVTCQRCGKTRVVVHTVYKSIKGTGFKIVPGKDPGITDLTDGFHPSGQFSKDPVFFESEIKRELKKIIDQSLEEFKDD